MGVNQAVWKKASHVGTTFTSSDGGPGGETSWKILRSFNFIYNFIQNSISGFQYLKAMSLFALVVFNRNGTTLNGDKVPSHREGGHSIWAAKLMMNPFIHLEQLVSKSQTF